MSPPHHHLEPIKKPVWFITGCSTGFGRELATQLLERGFRTVVTARNPDTGIQLGEPLIADGVGVTDYAAMVRHNVGAIVKALGQ